ncbi:endonuclease [Solemya velesiana gill symbiont]|uniref:Endonuclease n=2 Tax=Solemya velesiana gill symbiont TaxID=1918948 RepID=A0A1T2KSF4_9GAMM|nr:endonuclease [Solemya velesiana gill symbiont]
MENTTEKDWYIYILRCSDNSLYTGVTTDLERRVQEHNDSPRGARYTRARRPVQLVYAEAWATRSLACQREAEIKQLSRPEKITLISKAPLG